MRSEINKSSFSSASLPLLRSECGGFKCLKTWDSDKPRKCQVADQFMQCVYQRIDIQVIINSGLIIYSQFTIYIYLLDLFR